MSFLFDHKHGPACAGRHAFGPWQWLRARYLRTNYRSYTYAPEVLPDDTCNGPVPLECGHIKHELDRGNGRLEAKTASVKPDDVWQMMRVTPNYRCFSELSHCAFRLCLVMLVDHCRFGNIRQRHYTMRNDIGQDITRMGAMTHRALSPVPDGFGPDPRGYPGRI